MKNVNARTHYGIIKGDYAPVDSQKISPATKKYTFDIDSVGNKSNFQLSNSRQSIKEDIIKQNKKFSASTVTGEKKYETTSDFLRKIAIDQPLKKMMISKIQHKQKFFEDALKRFPACDVKIQELLKILRKDQELWQALDKNLEVRVIKVIDCDKEIVLHPAVEPKIKWSGKYHVYLTIICDDKRLVIDPTIGGGNSCAHVTENFFIKSNWKGTECRDYTLETIAPVDEFYDSCGEYTPEYTIDDFINYLFNEGYERHKFFYN